MFSKPSQTPSDATIRRAPVFGTRTCTFPRRACLPDHHSGNQNQVIAACHEQVGSSAVAFSCVLHALTRAGVLRWISAMPCRRGQGQMVYLVYVWAGNHGGADVKIPDAPRQTEASRPHPQGAIACRGCGWPAACNPHSSSAYIGILSICNLHPVTALSSIHAHSLYPILMNAARSVLLCAKGLLTKTLKGGATFTEASFQSQDNDQLVTQCFSFHISRARSPFKLQC